MTDVAGYHIPDPVKIGDWVTIFPGITYPVRVGRDALSLEVETARRLAAQLTEACDRLEAQ